MGIFLILSLPAHLLAEVILVLLVVIWPHLPILLGLRTSLLSTYVDEFIHATCFSLSCVCVCVLFSFFKKKKVSV